MPQPRRRHLDRRTLAASPPGLAQGKTKPDAIIDALPHAFVMEVRAAEVVPSEEYEFGHTLRFPRAVVPIREDKDWSDACTEAELREFLRDGRGVLTARRLRAKVEVKSEGEDTDEAGPASPSRNHSLMGGFREGGVRLTAMGSKASCFNIRGSWGRVWGAPTPRSALAAIFVRIVVWALPCAGKTKT